MDFYTFAAGLGFAGLLIMALSGLTHGHGGSHHDTGGTHGGHAGHGGHVGHAGHGPTSHEFAHHTPIAHHATHAHGHGAHHAHGHGAHHGAGDAGRGSVSGVLMGLLSPRVIFTVLCALGATGIALEPYLDGGVRFAAALGLGLAFERLLAAPFFAFLFRFASAPALTLESAVMDTARAVSGFDARGQGLIALELDGQVVQLLGTLKAEERAGGVRVRAGDTLLIEEVDGQRQRCVVSRLGAR
ncbi:hypothetical protein [Longimicrobium sp.]|jgi:hypothetical protein|uniref:hypothetical protein n=1 Tax=Longimicrobium sp. TaxID=2029185 RepID=UPI002F939A3F